jgi:hypothetical protein
VAPHAVPATGQPRPCPHPAGLPDPTHPASRPPSGQAGVGRARLAARPPAWGCRSRALAQRRDRRLSQLRGFCQGGRHGRGRTQQHRPIGRPASTPTVVRDLMNTLWGRLVPDHEPIPLPVVVPARLAPCFQANPVPMALHLPPRHLPHPTDEKPGKRAGRDTIRPVGPRACARHSSHTAQALREQLPCHRRGAISS